MFRLPKIAVVYIYPLAGAQGFREKAAHFVDTYHRHPPGIDHETIIVSNGARTSDGVAGFFSTLPNVKVMDHDNSGWDIGGFQLAARTIPCDLMVFFGAHTYFRREGWLARMLEVYLEYGVTLYGATGNQGNIGVGVYPHVRTTAFWCPPSLLNDYPYRVTQTGGGGQRYDMEHSKNCLSMWVKSIGLQPYIVGFDSILPLEKCDSMPNGYHKNNQENVLVGDRMTMPPYYHCP